MGIDERRTLAAVLASSAVLSPGAAIADYGFHCLHGKIRTESGPPTDVGRPHVASSLCTRGSFLSDARGFATKNWRGDGQACSCR